MVEPDTARLSPNPFHKVEHINLLAVQNQTSPLILSFGVSDPVGAIGIQADLASFAAMGCHGLSVITSIQSVRRRGSPAIASGNLQGRSVLSNPPMRIDFPFPRRS